MLENNIDSDRKMDKKLFDLNTRPQRINGSTSNNLDKDILGSNNHDSIGVVPVELFKQEVEK
ncbi:B-box zinc finger protein [Arachis hypogaea]|nr:B-box zinc finger protein [Arachis hypogaea]